MSIGVRRLAASVFTVLLSLVMLPAGAASTLPISPARLDRTVTRAMQAFAVPGVAVGIVKDGRLVFAKGYGVREYGKSERVDTDTVFQIGSNTKAFTAAALAICLQARAILQLPCDRDGN